MINFRYHIVSLMAVFLALAVGITLGVTLVSDEANEGLAAQAEQDRKQVQAYREQLEQQRVVNDYRDAYAKMVGRSVTRGMLSGTGVALVTMPGAPRSTISAIKTAINDSGGTLTATAAVSSDVFDPEESDDLTDLVNDFPLQYEENATVATQFGSLLGRSMLAGQPGTLDQMALDTGDALNGQFVQISRNSDLAAELAIVVTAPAADPPVGAEALTQHVECYVALVQRSRGGVVAGPNSTGIDGTDVATLRAEPQSRELLSSVDAADLPSGVSTVIMASREVMMDGQGHYGFANSSDAPAPELPN